METGDLKEIGRRRIATGGERRVPRQVPHRLSRVREGNQERASWVVCDSQTVCRQYETAEATQYGIAG